LLFVELQESYGALVVGHDDFQVCWVTLGESTKRGQFKILNAWVSMLPLETEGFVEAFSDVYVAEFPSVSKLLPQEHRQVCRGSDHVFTDPL